MSATFWRQIHGGSTHFPIALLLASVAFDLVGWRSRDEALRRGLHAAGFGSALVGLLGGFGAVIAGLMLSRGRTLGAGYERIHHLFVWPAVIVCIVCVGWRVFRRGQLRHSGLGLYIVGMSIAVLLMLGAGYSGGEMLLAAEGENAPPSLPLIEPTSASAQLAPSGVGQHLFLKNCAHCHGADARGDEGPDLHNLDWTDEQIAARIRNGKKGQMTAFAGKLSQEEINEVIAYLRTFK